MRLLSNAVLVSFHEVPGNFESLYLQLVLLLGVAVPGVAVAILRHAAHHLISAVALSPNLCLAIFRFLKNLSLLSFLTSLTWQPQPASPSMWVGQGAAAAQFMDLATLVK